MAVVERITRTIFRPCGGLAVKHQVKFGSKMKNSQSRKGELYRYDYNSETYSDVTSLSSLTLETSDFLFLEKLNYSNETENEKVFFSYPHLFKLKRALKEVMEWFYDERFENLFVYMQDGDVVINSDYAEMQEISHLIQGKAIRIIPAVVEIEEQLYEGVTMFLNSESQFVQMTIDQVESLYDFFSTFDLYQSSQLLINYVTTVNHENAQTSSFKRTSGGSNNIPKNTKKRKKKKADGGSE